MEGSLIVLNEWEAVFVLVEGFQVIGFRQDLGCNIVLFHRFLAAFPLAHYCLANLTEKEQDG